MTIQHKSPAGGSAGHAETRPGTSAGAGTHFHFTPSRPACQALFDLFARWLAQARACAARDLAAAETAKASGDLDGYHRLRRRGLRHQVMQVTLENVLGGGIC